jgi:ferredoxin--NADP+ reductase
MSTLHSEEVTSVRHWTESLFSFTTTRNAGFRFQNGQFAMIGLEVGGRPLLRAYSLASANYEENLEFFSIKVPDGPLTSRLRHLQTGDRNLMATGTGLAPFLSIIKDPETYERYEKVVLVHGCRQVAELAYRDFITQQLPQHEFIGEMISEKLIYFPTVTREPFHNRGRLTDLITSDTLFDEIGLPPLSADHDRVMMCGSPSMLRDLVAIVRELGFEEGNHSEPGQYVIEKAFVEK